MPQVTSAPLADGQTIAAEAGSVVVAVQCVRPNAAYRLSIRYAASGFEVPELSRSFPDERTARRAARTATVLFRSGITVQQALDLLAVFNTPAGDTAQAEPETCTGCGQPITTPNALPEALRTAGKRQCEACDLFDRL